MNEGMNTMASAVLLLAAFIVLIIGLFMRSKAKNANQEVRADERYEHYVKKSNFITILGIILVYIVIALILLPWYFGALGLLIMTIYILAYSLHISSGIEYKKIVSFQLVIILVIAISIYLLKNFS
ncbi:MAG: hypothetical protein Q4P31_02945 [Andreesenia angusta]|nr:hypothetical protein [Andreesenia angusta]